MLDRRSFLTGLLAAPAIVRAGSLDFVPRGSVLMPTAPIWYGFDMSSRDSISIVSYQLRFRNGHLGWEADTIERMHRA